jgi:hypothetical protein
MPRNPADAPSHMKRLRSESEVEAAIAAVEKSG